MDLDTPFTSDLSPAEKAFFQSVPYDPVFGEQSRRDLYSPLTQPLYVSRCQSEGGARDRVEEIKALVNAARHMASEMARDAGWTVGEDLDHDSFKGMIDDALDDFLAPLLKRFKKADRDTPSEPSEHMLTAFDLGVGRHAA